MVRSIPDVTAANKRALHVDIWADGQTSGMHLGDGYQQAPSAPKKFPEDYQKHTSFSYTGFQGLDLEVQDMESEDLALLLAHGIASQLNSAVYARSHQIGLTKPSPISD